MAATFHYRLVPAKQVEALNEAAREGYRVVPGSTVSDEGRTFVIMEKAAA